MGIERPSGRRYFAIARELVRRGYHVRILALHPDLANCAERRFVLDGVEVWYVGQMHARKRGSETLRFGPLALLRVLVASTLGMIWGCLCSPADLYHLGKPQPVNGLAALLAIRLLGRQFYLDCDDDEVESNRLTAKWQRAVFGFWQWLLPKLAAGVTVNTDALVNRMQRRGVAPVVLVPNGTDLERFAPPAFAVRVALQTALGLQHKRVVAYIGTVALQNHPVDLLLDAFAVVVTECCDAVLLVVGGGEDLDLARNQARRLGIEDRVRFTGHVAPNAVPALLALAELSVDPVRDDATARARSPLKIVESMALHVPVVTAAVGDRAAMLANGNAGALVAPDDPVALGHEIAALLRDRARRASLAEHAASHVRQYNWPELARRWEAVYGGRGLGPQVPKSPSSVYDSIFIENDEQDS